MKSLMLAGSSVLLLTACFTYRPLGSVDAAMPTPGTRVEVRLTTTAAAALANQVGPDVLYLQGDVVSADSTALTVAVTQSETARRISTEWRGEHFTLPREDIASLSQRKLSVGATALLGGLAGGGIVAAAAAFSGGSSSTGSTGGNRPGGVQ
jgi:hypothetical protein